MCGVEELAVPQVDGVLGVGSLENPWWVEEGRLRSREVQWRIQFYSFA